MMRISSSSFAETLGLVAVGDPPKYLADRRGIAELIRRFVFARGCVTRREVSNYLAPIFQAVQEFDQNSKAVFVQVGDMLTQLGDLCPIRINREHGWGRTPFRWIATSPTSAVVLGHLETEFTGAVRCTAENRTDLVRRYSTIDSSISELFSPTNQLSIEEWIGVGAWNKHRERRGGDVDASSIESFWDCLLTDLSHSDAVASDDGSLKILSGPPGGRFGKHNSIKPQGRWTSSLKQPDGTYLACYSARNQNDWRFLLIELKGHHVVRAITLENSDEFQWALLARGVHTREQESIIVNDRDVHLTFPPPKQLRWLLNLLGTQNSGWKWRLANRASIEQLQFWAKPSAMAQ
jgi:hypothetical protein